jgi:hypothetical protein
VPDRRYYRVLHFWPRYDSYSRLLAMKCGCSQIKGNTAKCCGPEDLRAFRQVRIKRLSTATSEVRALVGDALENEDRNKRNRATIAEQTPAAL